MHGAEQNAVAANMYTHTRPQSHPSDGWFQFCIWGVDVRIDVKNLGVVGLPARPVVSQSLSGSAVPMAGAGASGVLEFETERANFASPQWADFVGKQAMTAEVILNSRIRDGWLGPVFRKMIDNGVSKDTTHTLRRWGHNSWVCRFFNDFAIGACDKEDAGCCPGYQ